MPATPIPPLPPVAIPPIVLPPPPIAPPGPWPVLPVTSEHKTSNDACIKRLKQLMIEPAVAIYPMTKPAAVFGSTVEVQSNVFGIEVQGSIELYQYSVHIKADLTNLKEIVFTKKGKEDFIVLDRHEKCCSVFYHALKQYEDFFKTNDNVILYDGQSMLYSKFDLFPNHSPGLAKTRVLPINGAETLVKDLEKFPLVKMEVTATKNPTVVFNQENVGKRSADPNIAAVNTAYRNILELALSQSCVQDFSRCAVFEHGKIFFIKPTEEGFHPNDIVDVGDGKRMMPGIKKTVQFVEGPYGRDQCNPSVVIDAMKVAFHKEQAVVDKLREITNADLRNTFNGFEKERCAAVIKGLDCYSNYTGRVRHLKIEGLHHEGASKARFQMKDGGTTTVADYFKDRWKLTLKYPDTNLIMCKERGQLNYYPVELMFITANQRVKLSQMTSAQSQKTTKESAVQPNIRQRLIMTGKEAAKITSGCDLLEKMGIQVCEAPLLVKARQLVPVKLAINTTGLTIQQRENKWRMNEYYRPAGALKAWTLLAVGSPSSRFTVHQLNTFATEFMNMCSSKGIQIASPTHMKCVLASEIEAEFAYAHEHWECKFILCITDDSITNVHQKYKAIEIKRSIIIQDMKMSKALSVIEQGKKLTLENVVNKTNVKLGGTNYIFADTKRFLDRVLVIGVGLSYPPPGTKFLLEDKGILNPTIVGFAHNGREKQEFTGDFVLSPAGQETLSSIEDIMTESLKSYQKWRKGELPERVIVYRSGVSEGTQQSVMSFEIPLARSAMNDFSPKMKLIYIAVSKDHTCRFFRNDLSALSQRSGSISGSQHSGYASKNSGSSSTLRACDINIGPGISIDHNVTNPAVKQFFLNSHITLQGTAKTPLYSVLADDTQAKMESLEELTYSLCHLHQIVGLPTSLPTPLYVGNEYAKRGRNLWNEANQKGPTLRGDGPERERLREVTDSISYKEHPDLIDRRVNA